MNIIDTFDDNKSLEKTEEKLPVKKEEIVVDVQHKIEDDLCKLEKDLQRSSKVIDDLLDIGMRDVKTLSALASESENPRAYEVLSNMIGSIKDTAESLVELHHKKAVIKNLMNNGVVGKNTSVTEIGSVTNAVFVGSISDALKQISTSDVKFENSMDVIDIPQKPYQEIEIESEEVIKEVEEEEEA